MTETKESPVHHILFPNAVTASKFETDSVKCSSVLNGKGQIWNNQSLLSKCVKKPGAQDRSGASDLCWALQQPMICVLVPIYLADLILEKKSRERKESVNDNTETTLRQMSSQISDGFGDFDWEYLSLRCHIARVMWHAQALVQGHGSHVVSSCNTQAYGFIEPGRWSLKGRRLPAMKPNSEEAAQLTKPGPYYSAADGVDE